MFPYRKGTFGAIADGAPFVEIRRYFSVAGRFQQAERRSLVLNNASSFAVMVGAGRFRLEFVERGTFGGEILQSPRPNATVRPGSA
jgi:hypothetical protein